MKYKVDSAHGGEGWVPRKQDHSTELGHFWNNCGVKGEFGTLSHVLLRSPGLEVEQNFNPADILWTERIEPSKAREQHNNLIEVYRSQGVEVELIDDKAAESFPNILYVRDLFTMTDQGAILSRMASEVRAGEEVIISKKLSELGIPILASLHSDMILEGPDILIVNPDLVFIGYGIRTNYKAAMYVKQILLGLGYSEVIIIQTTYGCGHLDGVVNILNSRYAAIVPKRVSYELYIGLKRHGFSIIELDDMYEIDQLMSINFVQLNEETLLINKGAKNTVSQYSSCGFECLEIDISELTKGGGSIHCLTGILRRI
ncbi:dimethylarginine dimethylaminohydrolase family protein [Bacillus subtilis]